MPERPKFINIAGKLLDLSVPKVMGIINATPDSFYGGSRLTAESEIINAATRMLDEGAAIIDVGGYSTRPDAGDVPPDVEKERVLGAVRIIRKELPAAVVSIDTFRAEIAAEAVEELGVHIINDISGGEMDKEMFSLVKRLNVPYIMMHMQGIPATMQNNPVYDDVVADILKWFSRKISYLQSEGVKDIILDPGFGFGKTIRHNFEMLKRLGDFTIAGLPLLIGISRKSMIWKTLGLTPDEALNGTSVLNGIALLNGADILRVHDVKEAVQAVKLIEKLKAGTP